MENIIRQRRKELGLSQEELAKRCGVSRQTVNAIENNKYDPTLALAFRLAGELQVTVDQPIPLEQLSPGGKPAGQNAVRQRLRGHVIDGVPIDGPLLRLGVQEGAGPVGRPVRRGQGQRFLVIGTVPVKVGRHVT